MNKEMRLLKQAKRFMCNWQPEKWASQHSPGLIEARNLRLSLAKWWKSLPKELRKQIK